MSGRFMSTSTRSGAAPRRARCPRGRCRRAAATSAGRSRNTSCIISSVERLVLDVEHGVARRFGSARRGRLGGGRIRAHRAGLGRPQRGSTMLKVELLPGVAHLQRRAHRLRQLARDHQAQAGAGHAVGLGAEALEVLEQPRLLLRASGRRLRRAPRCGRGRRLARSRRAPPAAAVVLDRVGQQVHQHLLEGAGRRTQCVHGGGRLTPALFGQRRDEGQAGTAPRRPPPARARRRRAGARCARGRARRRSAEQARAGLHDLVQPALLVGASGAWRSSAISCAKPRMPFSGVRSSWLMREKTRSWRGWRARRRPCPGAAVVSACSVTSRQVASMLVGAPFASTSVLPTISSVRRLPSGGACARARSAGRAWRSPVAPHGRGLRGLRGRWPRPSRPA